MPLLSVKFLVTSTYGTLALLLYFLEIYVILRWRSKFRGSFFTLFLAQSIINCITYVNSFVTLRLPQNTCRFCFMEPFFAGRHFPGLEIFHTIHYQMAFVQYLMIMVVSLNRFSMVFFPFTYEKMWKRPLPVLLFFVLTLPFIMTSQILFHNSTYNYVVASDWYATVSDSDMTFFYRVLIIFMIIVTSISTLLKSATLFVLFSKNLTKGVKRTEILLILHSFVNFTIMLFAATITIFNFYGVDDSNRDNWFAVIGQLLLPFVSDGLTIVSPFLLLICSSSLRATILQVLTRRSQTPVVSASLLK